MTTFKRRDLHRLEQYLHFTPEKLSKKQKKRPSKSDLDLSLLSGNIEKACLFPPFWQIESFADDLLINTGFSSTLSDLMQHFSKIAVIGGNYFLRDFEEQCKIADAIEDVKNLPLSKRYTFCQIPMSINGKTKSQKLDIINSFAQ